MPSKRSHNALTHGLYARDTVLPWEDAGTFAAHHQAIREELCPNEPLEEAAVQEIADLQWRKLRLTMGFLLPYYKNAPPPELIEAAKNGLASLASYLAENGNSSGTFMATFSQALDLVKRRSADKTVPLPVTATPSSSVVEQAYDPVTMASHLKVEAMIDGRLAKALGRLVALKEYKKLYAHKASRPARAEKAPPVEEAAHLAPPPVDPPAPAANTNTKPASGWTVTGRRS